jgi:hypothetical protein
MASIDGFPGETTDDKIAKLERMVGAHAAYTEEELRVLFRESSQADLWRHFIDGPFQVCRRALSSKVERAYSTIYDLSPAIVGRDDYDLVFVGDVLLHTIDPLRALAACARLCAGTLVISQVLAGGVAPSRTWVGGAAPGVDSVSWWLPNERCLIEILQKLRFRDVRLVDRHPVTVEPIGFSHDAAVVHARR